MQESPENHMHDGGFYDWVLHLPGSVQVIGALTVLAAVVWLGLLLFYRKVKIKVPGITSTPPSLTPEPEKGKKKKP